MPQDLEAFSAHAGPGRPRRRRGRGGPAKKNGGPNPPPPHSGGGAESGGGAGYGGGAYGGYGNGGAVGGYQGGPEGAGGGDWGGEGAGGGGGSGDWGGGDWGGGRPGRRRRGRRGGRGAAPRRSQGHPGAGTPQEGSAGGGYGDGPGYEGGAHPPGDAGAGAPGFEGGSGYGGAYPEPEGFPPRERRGGAPQGPRGGQGQYGGAGRGGAAFQKPGKKGRRGQPKPRGRFRESGGAGGGGGGPQHVGELVGVTGVLELEKGGAGFLRQPARNFHRLPEDTFVSPQIVHRYGLRDGSFIEGRQTVPAGPGKKPMLREVLVVDGMDPQEARRLPQFKRLVSVDPDFQYRLGDVPIETGMEQGDTSLRIMDMLMPLGRGQRALVVAPPRGGKTILLQKMAKAIELKYPDVHLMVLLIDERPEEGTHWKRTVKGEVYVSTADESAKDHIQTAEGVWRRACRLCECGQEVVLLLDSITRLARAYNQEIGNSGRILSGGIDSRTMERPKKIFGSARNTEDGGSLTIIGTCLVDTGSRMDQVIFEEFKGTGNMEINLSRFLAEKRIFPAFDLAGSGTRKEERLLDRAELMKVSLLRRVLNKMRPMEAMELLIKKLEQYPTNRDFLEQFNLVNYQ